MISEEDLSELVAMHQYCRPHWSPTEFQFINRFIRPLGMVEDHFGNLFKQVGEVKEAKILWSCHTDTVHRVDGKQQIMLGDNRYLFLPIKTTSTCLGADNTAGVWMLTQMIKQKIPGLYVFHRGEEVGCKGSKYVLATASKVLKMMNAAIAFDREGTLDIIDHQLGTRCASWQFVKSLADGLKLGHMPRFGIYTDTATYVRTIPECTNISVGYYGAHSSNEYLDLEYLCKLRDAVFGLDLSKLIIARDPTKFDNHYAFGYWKDKGKKKKNRKRRYRRDIQPEHDDMPDVFPTDKGTRNVPSITAVDRSVAKHEISNKLVTMAGFCAAYPDVVADYLETHGIDLKDLENYLDDANQPLEPADELPLEQPSENETNVPEMH